MGFTRNEGLCLKNKGQLLCFWHSCLTRALKFYMMPSSEALSRYEESDCSECASIVLRWMCCCTGSRGYEDGPQTPVALHEIVALFELVGSEQNGSPQLCNAKVVSVLSSLHDHCVPLGWDDPGAVPGLVGAAGERRAEWLALVCICPLLAWSHNGCAVTNHGLLGPAAQLFWDLVGVSSDSASTSSEGRDVQKVVSSCRRRLLRSAFEVLIADQSELEVREFYPESVLGASINEIVEHRAAFIFSVIEAGTYSTFTAIAASSRTEASGTHVLLLYDPQSSSLVWEWHLEGPLSKVITVASAHRPDESSSDAVKPTAPPPQRYLTVTQWSILGWFGDDDTDRSRFANDITAACEMSHAAEDAKEETTSLSRAQSPDSMLRSAMSVGKLLKGGAVAGFSRGMKRERSADKRGGRKPPEASPNSFKRGKDMGEARLTASQQLSEQDPFYYVALATIGRSIDGDIPGGHGGGRRMHWRRRQALERQAAATSEPDPQQKPTEGSPLQPMAGERASSEELRTPREQATSVGHSIAEILFMVPWTTSILLHRLVKRALSAQHLARLAHTFLLKRGVDTWCTDIIELSSHALALLGHSVVTGSSDEQSEYTSALGIMGSLRYEALFFIYHYLCTTSSTASPTVIAKRFIESLISSCTADLFFSGNRAEGTGLAHGGQHPQWGGSKFLALRNRKTHTLNYAQAATLALMQPTHAERLCETVTTPIAMVFTVAVLRLGYPSAGEVPSAQLTPTERHMGHSINEALLREFAEKSTETAFLFTCLRMASRVAQHTASLDQEADSVLGFSVNSSSLELPAKLTCNYAWYQLVRKVCYGSSKRLIVSLKGAEQAPVSPTESSCPQNTLRIVRKKAEHGLEVNINPVTAANTLLALLTKS